MRTLFDIFGQTVRTLWAHKLRSFLTMFGIAWGVGSLLLLVGVGEGFRSGNRRQLEQVGEDVITMFPGRAPAVEGHVGTRQYYLTYDDYLAVRTQAPNVRNASAWLTRADVRGISEFGSSGMGLMGVTPNANEIRKLDMAAGRWINDADNDQRRLVTVIAVDLRKNLFPGRPALGSTVVFNGHRFEVVGLLRENSFANVNAQDTRAFIPYQTMRTYFPQPDAPSPDVISYITYQPRVRLQNAEAKEDVHKIIGRHQGFDWHNKDAFQDWDTIEEEHLLGRIYTAIEVFLGGVGLVTLALGAVGIINIMLVAVAERTPEIGLRKALGATNRSVMFQFFLEGAFLTVASGFVGMTGALGLMRLMHALPMPAGYDPPMVVPETAALAIGALALAGIAAGLYPARKAAMLQPVEALRRE